MKIHVCNDNKVFPFYYVDDWYTPEEEKLIWKELDFYTNPITMHRAGDVPKEEVESAGIAGTAKNPDGTSMAPVFTQYVFGSCTG